MALRTPLALWGATFFGTLGLSSLTACGGTTAFRSDADSGAGGAPSGAGGSSAGGSLGTGGTGSGGKGSGGKGSGAGGVFGGSGGRGAGGARAAGGSTNGTGGAPLKFSCNGPTPYVSATTGFVACAGGGIHRTEKVNCLSRIPRAQACVPLYTWDGGPQGSCVVDSDCTAQPNGYCTSGGGGQVPGCFCGYGCTRDADCGANSICLCGDPVGQCVPALCAQDSECGGGLCLSYTSSPGCGGIAFACQSAADDCFSDKDCASPQQCSLVEGAHRCVTPNCAIGRPFLVGGVARLADVARRRDWSSALAPCVRELDPPTRAALAIRWTEIALMEHASIAAFARFALEILSLGAPPELVVATHAAMADETVHARDAFALASAYAERPIGPGALDVGVGGARSAREIVRTTILEGCIGETIAAVEAAEALAYATDPAVREALAKVTLDETRHAELAWRFVQWVLEHGEPELRRAVAIDLVEIADAERIASEREAPTPDSGAGDAAALRAHGALSLVSRAEIRRRVLSEVVAPCARAVVRRAAAASAPVSAGRRVGVPSSVADC